MKSVLSSDHLLTLQHPGTLVFPENLSFLTGVDIKHCRVQYETTGHMVYFGPHGRRILATDPEGNPLHECEWEEGIGGSMELRHARVRLDWGQWVGLRPAGIIHSTILDLTTKKNWQALQADDLRAMAAQSIGVGLEEVKFFYSDEDLAITVDGQAKIRHRKDALYVLNNGVFEKARFMACMGAMHWDRIDFLPVVELFQSLLPGTGSAIFELIYGLTGDQYGVAPIPFRYRGVPTYPSEAAYRLFNGFFAPQIPDGGNPFPLFMNPSRSHEVTWLPVQDAPKRYFDSARSLCVTVKEGKIQKLTMMDDASGMSYMAPSPLGRSPGGKSVTVVNGIIHIRDGNECAQLDSLGSWGDIVDSEETLERFQGVTWQDFFQTSLKPIDAYSAFSAVLLYPEDGTEIDETSCQPFIGDYIEDILSEHEQLVQHLGQTEKVFISSFDGAIGSCLHFDRPRQYDIVYQNQALAQRHAQRLWNQLAASRRLDWGKNFRFHDKRFDFGSNPQQVFDLIFYWTPFSLLRNEVSLGKEIDALARLFHVRTIGFVAGSLEQKGLLENRGLSILQSLPGHALPGFLMHKGLLPQAELPSGLMLHLVVKGR